MLTPEEIQSREFLVSLRGYDRDEVHAFLGRVAEQLAQTDARATQLQQRLDRLKAQQPALGGTAEPAPAAAQAASPEPSAMFAEIGKETQRILEAAQEAGQQIQRKARQDADRELQSARGQAAKLIAEGERRREHVEKIVSELEQRRAAMSVQLRGIGRTIDQTLKDLGPSDGSTTVRQAIGAEVTESSTAAAAEEPASEAESEAPAPAEEPAPTASAEADADSGDTAVADEEPAAPAPEASAQNEPAEAPAEPAIGPDDGAAPAAPAPAEPAVEEPPAAAAEPADTSAAAADEAPVAAATSDGGSTAVTEPAISAAEPTPATPPVSAPDAATGRKDPQGLRATALSPLHPKLVRKVKRELQEIQNIALDKVRRAKGSGEVDDFLPTDDDTSGLAEGSTELLEQAWLAGVASAAVLADRDLGEAGDAPDLAGDFLSDASERIRTGLSSTLRMGLSASDGAQGLSDRIGAAFGEFKGAQAEELAATHLIRAYEYGLLAAWKSGGIDARRWVMGREPRCPEARCRTNDQGGDVAVSDSFPSGHDVPPVHVGCTCTTVPAVDGTS